MSGGLTRRALLAGAAVAGVAGACVRPVAIEGSVIASGAGLGHVLRDGIPTPAGAAGRTDAVVVGAGVAGLAAARHLLRAGVRDMLVFELESSAGGNARAGASAVTAYPWGAHYLPLPGPEATAVRALLADLGVIEGFDGRGRPRYDERQLCHAPQERLFIHGRWQDGLFPHTGAGGDDLAQYEAFRVEMDRVRRWRDRAGRRAFATPRAAGAPDAFADLDRLSMADWLRAHGWTSPRLRWYVEYACRDDYGTALADTSAWAGVHYYASRDPDPEYGDAVLTWPEGNAWITSRMAEPLGERLRTGTLVVNVEPAGARVAVDVYDAVHRTTTRTLAREVVLACPLFVAARVYRPWRERPPAFVGAFTYAPWLVANLHLDAPPSAAAGAPLAWDNVIYDSDSLGYVVATHQSMRMAAGATVVSYYLPFAGQPAARARRALLDTSWAAWRDRILRDLGRPHPTLARSVRRLDVAPYGHAMVRPAVGFVCGAARRAAVDALRGPVHLGHSDLSGFSLFEEAYHWGQRAAVRAAASLGRPLDASSMRP